MKTTDDIIAELIESWINGNRKHVAAEVAFFDSGRFLVGEPVDHCAKSGRPRYDGYCARQGAYFRTSRPMTVSDFKALDLPLEARS